MSASAIRKSMPKKQRPLPIPKELPPCDGPKLNLFEHHECEIEWIERIGWEEGMGPPNEGYVFRVKINKVEYALKVVSCYRKDSYSDQLHLADHHTFTVQVP